MREPGGRLRPVVCLADAEIPFFGVQRNIRCFQGIFLALLIAGLNGHNAISIHFEHFRPDAVAHNHRQKT